MKLRLAISVAAIVAGVANPGHGAASGQNADSGNDVVSYLRKNAHAIPPGGVEAPLPPGFLGIRDPRLYLLGEVHGFAANNDADLSLLRHLHRVTKLRTYLSEISYAHSWYLNRYLDSGDPRFLDIAFEAWRGRTVDATREKRRFWERLRAWNVSLPPADRIRIAGVDLERFPGITLSYLRSVIKPGVPLYVRSAARDLLALDAASSPQALKIAADRFGLALDTSHSECEASMGEDWLFGVEQAVHNLQERGQAGAEHRTEFDEIRDRAMYDNFLSVSPRLAPGSLYGRIGFAHVLRHPWNRVDWLGYYLNREPSPWAGKVIGIWPLYRDAYRLALDRGRYTDIEASDEARLTDPFGRASAAPITLFKLDAHHSPFFHLLLIPGADSGGVTTDYVQYAMLFQGAVPATPWVR